MKKFLLLNLFLISSLNFSQTLIETIDLPSGTFYEQAYGLVYNNSKYWISSYSSTGANGIIKAVDATGTEVDQITINYSTIKPSQGLTNDETNFWYIERYGGGDFFKAAPDGTVLDSIISSQLFGGSWYIGGAGWDGTGLWVSIYYPNANAGLYKIDVSTKTIVDTIQTYGIQPQGITVKGDTLFYVMDDNDGDPEKVFAVNLATEDTLFSFPVPDPNGQSPRGLAWDGTYFWLLAEPVGASSGRQLFKYDLGGSGTPEITVPVSTINFPNTTVGNTSNYNLTIYSTGSATLRLDSIAVSGNSFSFNSLSFPINIPPGGSQNVTVNFTPSSYTFYQGLLKIYSNDPIDPIVDVNLKGHGVLSGARIGLSATSHNFGNVWVGQDGITFWNFKIFNMGDQTLDISDMQFTLPEFSYNSPTIPFQIFSTDTLMLIAYFYPTQAGTYLDTLKITSNDLTNPITKISVQGTGYSNPYNYGYLFWQYQVPMNPFGGSYQEFRIEGLKPINDITGDGINEVIISTDNYYTMCLNGAASGFSFPIWIFNTYFNSSNAGSIGQSNDYGVQDALQIANDLNGDGKNDVVIGTGGSNEHVYAINGTNGEIIWSFGDDVNYGLGNFEAVDVQRDFNGDSVEDVLAIADGNQYGTGYHSAYLFDGTDGDIIWQYYYPGPSLAFGKTIISINDINDDNKPDAIIAVGDNGCTSCKVFGLNGVNGQQLWSREMVDWEPKELLEVPLPGDSSDVIAAEYFDTIHRLNGRTGEEVWSYPLGGLSGVIQMSLIGDLNNDFIPDVLIASFANNGLNCLSGADGIQLWAHQMDFQYGVAAVPDIDDDGVQDVITGDQTGTFYCISGKVDTVIFSHNYPGDRINTVNIIPSIDGNFSYELLAGTLEGVVACFSGGTIAVPVELTTFIGNVINGKVVLNWSTATETNNSGFDVERKSDNTWEQIGFVPGSGTTTELRSYTYTDDNVFSGKYSYRLKQIDFNGKYEYSEIVNVEVGIPSEYSLEQNYPNPFNPSTTINYSVKAKGLVTLKMFDILGNEVKTLVNEEKEAGKYSVKLDASQLASGIYFYTLKAGEFISTKKMVLLK